MARIEVRSVSGRRAGYHRGRGSAGCQAASVQISAHAREGRTQRLGSASVRETSCRVVPRQVHQRGHSTQTLAATEPAINPKQEDPGDPRAQLSPDFLCPGTGALTLGASAAIHALTSRPAPTQTKPRGWPTRDRQTRHQNSRRIAINQSSSAEGRTKVEA